MVIVRGFIFMKELKFNLRYIFQRKELYIFIIGVFLVNLLHIWLTIDDYRHATYVLKTSEYQFMLYSVSVDLMGVIIIGFPILCTLPLADSTWLEEKGGTTSLLLPRLSIKKNNWIRFMLSIVVIFLVCFAGFMIQYAALYFMFGSGNIISHWGSMAYSLIQVPDFFLEHIRYTNPVLFIICLSAHVSFIIGLLSGVAFSFSFFTRQRLLIYFQTALFVILTELICAIMNLNKFSIFKQLQPSSKFSFTHSLVVYSILLIIGIVPIYLYHRKKYV